MKPTPAELAALEHEFATDPSGEAYHPLAEAYLSLGRFMEAMVVCKKGMRALPKSAEPRLLLARVQTAQNRHQRALEEVDAALALEPNHLLALRLAAELRFELGERDLAEGLLRRAAQVDPNDLAVAELARSQGISLEAAAQPTEEPPAAEPVAEEPKAEPPPAADPVAEQTITEEQEASQVAKPAPRAVTPPAKAAQKTSTKKPSSQKRAPRQEASPPQSIEQRAIQLSAWDDDEDDPVRPARPRNDLRRLVMTASILAVALGGWAVYSKWQGEKERQIASLLQETTDLVRKDTYLSYKEATEAADRVLALDGGNFQAHATLAYVSALRWGEHGEGEALHRRSVEHLAQAKKGDAEDARLIAAEALVAFFEGSPAKAVSRLREAMTDQRRAGLGLLWLTLATVQMEAGELEEAAASLKSAQGFDFNSVRLLSTQGRLHWRRGMEPEAWAFFDSALRVDGSHADSQLGKALLILDSEENRGEGDREKLLDEAGSQIQAVLGLPNGAISTRQLAKAKFARGQLLIAQGKADEGGRLEQEAFALDPTSADIRLLRGRRLLREGKDEAAIRDIESAIRIEPRLASYADLSKALRGKPKDRIAAMEEATKGFSQSGRAWVLLGEARAAAREVAGAREAFEKALEVEGGKMPDARVRLAILWRREKDFAKATKELEQVIADLGPAASGPTAASAHTEMGRVFEEGSRDAVRAFQSYAKAIAAWEKHGPGYFYLGRISAGQRSAEQRRQAVESLETYLRLEPKGAMAAEARSLLATLR